MNQKQLLMYITQVGFALYDVTLFLDTHPCDREALAYYEKAKEQYNSAVKKYTKEFGPLTTNTVDASCSWEWVQGPWPWE